MKYNWTRDPKARQHDLNRLPIDLFNTWWEQYSTDDFLGRVHASSNAAEKIVEDVNCFLEHPTKELRKILIRKIEGNSYSDEWCRDELDCLDTYEENSSFKEKDSKISSIDQRTDSNEGKPNTQVIKKNNKKPVAEELEYPGSINQD